MHKEEILSNIIQERLQQSVDSAKIIAHEGNLHAVHPESKPISHTDFPMGVPLFDGYSRLFETMMPSYLDLEMAALLNYH